MAQTYSALRSAISVGLQDSTISGQASSNAQFPTAELDLIMADCLREIALYVPYEVKESLTIESRTGTANGDTASALVDTTESQFVAGDVGKIVHNTTDNTWAVVTAYVSSSQLTLSKDIFPDGNECYKIFNKDCWNNKQVNISDITDGIREPTIAEYPVGHLRNITLQGNILELGLGREPDDSKVLSSGDQPDTEVLVHFDKRHRVSQLTDLVGAVNLEAGYVAGATSIVLDALQDSGTIEADQEFTIANVRGTYRVTAAAAITGNAATISFYPGLESAVLNDTFVTFKLSTLTPELEPIFCDLATGRASMSKTFAKILAINPSGTDTGAKLMAMGQFKIKDALQRLSRIAKPRFGQIYPRS